MDFKKKKNQTSKLIRIIYSWPLNYTGLTLQVHFYVNFFNKYVVSPPSPWVSYLQIQSTVDQKQHFWTKAGSLLMQRADCMHFYTILYNRLKHPQVLAFVRSPGTNSWGYRGMTVVKFWGNRKLYMDFRMHWGWHP